MSSTDVIPCPICKKPVSLRDDSPGRPWFPFCSQRCSLIDLGRWLDEKYQVPAEIDPDDDRTPNGSAK